MRVPSNHLLRGKRFFYRGRARTPGRRLIPILRRSPIVTIICFAWLAVSCAAGSAQTAVADQSQKDPELIHYGDIIDIDVVGSLEYDWRGGLTPEGFLDGPERLETQIFALCRTEDEVASSVRDGYRTVLREPNVVVRIVDRSNRALAYAAGAVRTPQRFQLRRPVSLAEIIVLSGGITDSSNGEITIFRPPTVNCRGTGTEMPSFENAATRVPKRFSVKISDLLSGKGEANIPILTGDIVTIAEAAPVFVTGDVRSPRRMNLTPDLTLSRAIMAAGGAGRSFKGQKARIFRRGAPGVLEFDMRKNSEGGPDDPKLEPYDVIEITQKGVEPRRVAPVADISDRSSNPLSRLPLRIVD